MPCPSRKIPPYKDCESCKEKVKIYMRTKRAANPEMSLNENRRRRKENPQYFRDAAKKSLTKLRTEVLQAYGGKCACCSEAFEGYLEIDHINDDGNKHRAETDGTVRGTYRDLRRKGFPPIVQVLCSNCHRAKTRKVSCPPHGPSVSEI